MKFAIACDPGGITLKEPVMEKLKELGIECEDYGYFDEPVKDYPVFAMRVTKAVVEKRCDRGILICGTGVGMSMAANKVKGIRCCHCSDCYSAKMSRHHNDANVLALGGRVISSELAKMIVEIWATEEFDGGRHQRRIDMFTKIEEGLDLE